MNGDREILFESAVEQKRQDLVEKFTWLENNLSDRPYFAGDRFSLVDAVYGPIYRYFNVFDAIANFHFSATTPKI